MKPFPSSLPRTGPLPAALLICALLCPATAKAEQGTADEARAMVDKAAALMRASGPERAMAEISNPFGAFNYRDLYVTVYSTRGRILAHGTQPQLIGRHAWDWRDANDKYYVREIVTRAQQGDTGPVHYTRVHPFTHQLRVKETWFRIVGRYVIACGAYK